MLSERTRETVIAASVAAFVSGSLGFTLQHSVFKPTEKKAPPPDAGAALAFCAKVCGSANLMAIQWTDGVVSRCECDVRIEVE